MHLWKDVGLHLSYFLIAEKINHQDQGSIEKIKMIGAHSSRVLEHLSIVTGSMVAGRLA